jgi:hypothetical protein
MSMLNAALRLAQTFPVFPVAIYRDGGKVAKQPITPHGFKDASRDTAQIVEWWSDNPAAAIGLATGCPLPSGRRLLVLDVDLANSRNAGKIAGIDALNLLAAHGLHTPTRAARTGSGGVHFYYSMPHGSRVTIGQSLRIDGQATAIDWRGHGGYVVAPPSPYPGSAYRWARPSPWTAETIQRAPEALLALLTRRESSTDAVKRIEAALSSDAHQRAYGARALANACAAIDNSAVGDRHRTLNKQAFCVGRLIAGGCLDQADAEAALTAAALRAGKPPREIARTLRDALGAGAALPLTAPDRRLTV